MMGRQSVLIRMTASSTMHPETIPAGMAVLPSTRYCVEIFESVNPNTLGVTNIPLSGAYVPLSESYSEVAALTHLSGNILLLTDIDQNLYQITTSGVVTFVGAMDHVAKGLAFVNAPVTSLLAAMLPSSRSVQVGATATAFATMINAGSSNRQSACAPTL